MESRRTSCDDSCLPDRPAAMFMAPNRMIRCKSADEIRLMRSARQSLSDVREAVWRNRSEGDHLTLVIKRLLAERKEKQERIAREICSSRSLFDSRFVPPVPPPSPAHATGKLELVRLVRVLQHYFIFLQVGILTALIWANANYDSYASLWLSSDPHAWTFHFVVNDIFMAFFFGIAMVHVTTALLPGGSLHPLRKAVSPLLGTIGGVVGPAMVYLALVAAEGNFDSQSKGWAICIATDISIAWLVATQVFGSGSHAAVQFLLLLAVVDDVIGLIVIAICFPAGDLHAIWLLLLLGSVMISLCLRYIVKVEHWAFYVLLAGPVSWYGLFRAGVHPSLAFCAVVPFIPASNLYKLDHACSLFVHVGLFFFALCNAGVLFDNIGLVTLNVSLSIVAGKTLGIALFTWLGTKFCGLALPEGMGLMDLGLLSHISGVGLTVALFVADMAFTDPAQIAQAKLGALLSIIVAPISLTISRARSHTLPQKPPNLIDVV